MSNFRVPNSTVLIVAHSTRTGTGCGHLIGFERCEGPRIWPSAPSGAKRRKVVRRTISLISGPMPSFLPGVGPTVDPPGDRRIVVSAKATYAGTQLDEHHAPETNGRMSVCRRCGTVTDGPVGLHHAPDERQLARSTEWLVSQSRVKDIDRTRQLRKK